MNKSEFECAYQISLSTKLFGQFWIVEIFEFIIVLEVKYAEYDNWVFVQIEKKMRIKMRSIPWERLDSFLNFW